MIKNLPKKLPQMCPKTFMGISHTSNNHAISKQKHEIRLYLSNFGLKLFDHFNI